METKKELATKVANGGNEKKVELPPLDVIIANLGFWLENAIIASRLLNEEARKKAKEASENAVSESK